mgnify:CR=1 FL=1
MKDSHILSITTRRQATLAVLAVAATSVSPLELMAQQLGHRVLEAQRLVKVQAGLFGPEFHCVFANAETPVAEGFAHEFVIVLGKINDKQLAARFKEEN